MTNVRGLLNQTWDAIVIEAFRILGVCAFIVLNIAVGYNCGWIICVLFYGAEFVLFLKWLHWVNQVPEDEKPEQYGTVRERNGWDAFHASERRRERNNLNRIADLHDSDL